MAGDRAAIIQQAYNVRRIQCKTYTLYDVYTVLRRVHCTSYTFTTYTCSTQYTVVTIITSGTQRDYISHTRAMRMNHVYLHNIYIYIY